MANKSSSGTMTLTSRTAIALWVNEISGQISDGMWENSRPHNHWSFWNRLEVRLGDVNSLVATERCLKNSYALTRLHQAKWEDGTYILRDRMLACGRMAKVIVDFKDRDMLYAAEFMPASLAAFRDKANLGPIAREHLAKVTDEIAVAYYAAKYTLKDMNADLKVIMDVMHEVYAGY